jgi:hypothetical protein
MSTTIGRDQHVAAGCRTALDVELDALILAGLGWAFDARPHGRGVRHAGPVAEADDRAIVVQRLLDELCVRLGFCLPPRAQTRLRQSPPLDPDEFTDAIFAAERMDPRLYLHLRHDVRAVVDRWLPHVVLAGAG